MSKARWRKFSKEEIEKFVKESYSIAQLAEKLGYSPKSGSGATSVKNMIEELSLDTSHFKGQGWNKNNFDYSRFQKGRSLKNGTTLKSLVFLRGRECEKCHLKEWQGEPIPLEVHHKDGDNLNNELENLEMLCPNCHALTPNWRGKNITQKRTESITEEEFVKALKESPSIRQALIKLNLSPRGGNYKRANDLIIKHQIFHLL